MERRILGSTGIEVRPIGLGGIPLTRLTVEEAAAVVSYALDKGVNFIETARGYWDSETKIGLAIKGRRDQVILASKCGAKDYDGMMAGIDKSLEALGTDYIDVYQIHYIKDQEALTQALAPGGAMQALRKAQREGKVRHIGVTAHEAKALVQCMETGEFTNVQLPFNIVERDACDRLIPLANERNVAVIVMKPLGGGILPNVRNSLRYILQQPISVIAVGMRQKSEVDENVAVASSFQPLSEGELAALMRQADELGTTFCRRCYYCMPCPQGVSIEMLLLAEMMHLRHGIDELMTMMNWDRALATAEKCVRCEQCADKCPYNLPIPDLVADALEKFMPLCQEWRAKHHQAREPAS
jgi:hypothetical protein